MNHSFLVEPAEARQEVVMSKITGGVYRPFFNQTKDGKKIGLLVPTFYMDRLPVTNKDYLQFVKKNKKWRRSQVKRLFAEGQYLKHWESDLRYKKKEALKPVRYVSWFAALRYCESQGKTLPTIVQWEYVGAADGKTSDALRDEKYKQKILKWYGRPSQDEVADVGKAEKNFWNVYDMHGLHWEWTLDFNTSLVTGESREDGSLNRDKFCGSGALGAKDKLDYGAFMRFGFRSSLKGDYTIGNLGFRCVKNIGESI